jgi:hypothetical protein
MALADALLWAVAAVQAVALLASLAVVWHPWLRGGGTLDRRPPAVYRRVHVLAHVADATPEDVEAFLDRLGELDYPAELVDAHLLATAEETPGRLADFLADLPSTRDRVRVDVLDVPPARGEWTLDGATPASPFDAALTSLSLPDDEVVAVLAVDDDLPDDLFERAAAGLERPDVDVVQAGRTAANPGDGPLPALTGAGLAAWSETVLPGGDPVAFLPSGHFTTARRLRSLRTQHPTTPVDVAAGRVGLSVGVLGCRVGEPVPTDVGAWLTGWRTRVRSFRRRVRRTDGVGRGARWRHPAAVLAVADAPLGAPLGLVAVGVAWTVGTTVPWPVLALVAAAALGWAVWSARRIAAVGRGGSGGGAPGLLWATPVGGVVGAVLWSLALRSTAVTDS